MAKSPRYSKLFGSATSGIDTVSVEVETSIIHGIPRHTIVGLPNSAVREALDRIRSAMSASGYKIPRGAITVNLAPADVRKEGTLYDLPIALGILVADGIVDQEKLQATDLILGELALDGSVRPVRGVLAAVLGAMRGGFKRVIVPAENFAEAVVVPEMEVIPVSSLRHVVEYLNGRASLNLISTRALNRSHNQTKVVPDLMDVIGQQPAIRGLEIAAAGRHNILLIGPPGCGKTLLSRAARFIQPDWSRQSILDSTSIHSLRGLVSNGLLDGRPFRAPHHSVSKAGMLGGGRPTLPGEVSLAHNGILFMDELAEYDRGILEGLREPLEDKRVVISRASGSVQYPADFQLLAAMNPCPCGYHECASRTCTCSQGELQRYRAKTSGPFLDRIDMTIMMGAVDPTRMPRGASGSTRDVKQRVDAAHEILSGSAPERIPDQVVALLNRLIQDLTLSMRSRDRIARVGRTIAAFDARTRVTENDIAEAMRFRTQAFE